MKNQEIAKILFKIADILQMRGVQWKPQAYRRAARTINNLSEPIERVYDRGGLKALEEMQTIGESIAKKIEQFLKTEKIKEYEELKKGLPKGFTDLLELPGMGPRKAQILFKKLHIKSLKDLEDAAKKHRIKLLKSFDEKSEQNILDSLRMYKKKKYKIPLIEASPIAGRIIRILKKLKGVEMIDVAGSLRRKKEMIGDIDILAVSSNPDEIIDQFTKMKEVLKVISKGKTKSSILLNNKMQVDLRVVKKESYGAALQYFTGSKNHNIKLREVAIRKGLKLSEYGVFDKKTGKKMAGESEKGVYKILGLKYIKPEFRENKGEIQKAVI